jgi:hypothetical protein
VLQGTETMVVMELTVALEIDWPVVVEVLVQ